MSAKRVLVAWIGFADNRAVEGDETGPILGSLQSFAFDELHLLSTFPPQQSARYQAWLAGHTSAPIIIHNHPLHDPTDYDAIYHAALAVCQTLTTTPGVVMTFQTSAGTPAMAAIWLLLAKTRYSARLIASSRERGAYEVNFPFDLVADYQDRSRQIERLFEGPEHAHVAFSTIQHRCKVMKQAIALASRLALHEVPVFIQGESGTGKELFARAIHEASRRSGGPFIAVNCGAIPEELIDAELFGYEKGAFTGANTARLGHFETASGGTLFLDEIGELPLKSQVRLLRALQQREIVRVGASMPRKIDVRIISATHRILPDEIRVGRFREDLFYRLAVGVLMLPPLRQRDQDLNLLTDTLLEGINLEGAAIPGFKKKTLDASARSALAQHSWPGNVRELYNVLVRASLWSERSRITGQDIADSLAVTVKPQDDGILHRRLDNPISLPDLLGDVARHYLSRAMEECQGNKAAAAKLLGLNSYQTLDNWWRKYVGE